MLIINFCFAEDWGPHLIIVPTSVMLNWEMEFKKWCPAFKILTYYGNPKERKLKRTGKWEIFSSLRYDRYSTNECLTICVTLRLD